MCNITYHIMHEKMAFLSPICQKYSLEADAYEDCWNTGGKENWLLSDKSNLARPTQGQFQVCHPSKWSFSLTKDFEFFFPFKKNLHCETLKEIIIQVPKTTYSQFYPIIIRIWLISEYVIREEFKNGAFWYRRPCPLC